MKYGVPGTGGIPWHARADMDSLDVLDAWMKLVPGREAEVFPRLGRALDEAAGRAGELRLTIPMAYVEAVAV
jgi:hypothetical protein